ncbi:hypothetical protein GCM10011386_33660 [Parapedobacter defluvii]|uniref:Transcriptional regulator, AbiEi antitoxin, Type IV TA system n=1 Tax=Parapedobacter defluvii TaxID=2045106 RepID=A0ABQ1MDK7_9SPHI|nr:hypothetical protein [Parapedobacter defluvii]GGC38781.1 hypothetical protein GCM10011386_33660 [Parapedobacter defluvii]
MDFLTFKERFFQLACFSTDQVYAWQPDFDRNNLIRWTKKGHLVRLRQGYYTFSEYKGKADYSLYFANRIYKPSYISLHTALAFYGIIPEAVVQITSITTLKTQSFSNDFGEYAYHNVREDLMFGYDLKPIEGNRNLQFAKPEKALLDLLYLYAFYDNEAEMEELRLDEDYLQDDLDTGLLMEYGRRFKSNALQRRLDLMRKTYRL